MLPTPFLEHAPPEALRVEVFDAGGNLLASGDQLARKANRPMARLSLEGRSVTRQDLWPEAIDIGRVVILAGGEAGRLQEWWNASDGTEWRWRIELYNRR